ncbi:hypothetical protein HOA91_06045 [Candidatus Woesearchaeota archaeon]|jgi:hypothetical protein|nr:hypothetical protein [Candidatus Woesearchaeota archaeon]
MDLEESIRKARMDFLNKLPKSKRTDYVENMKMRTAFSKDIYEQTRYIKQD